MRVRSSGVPIVGFTWYSLTDQIDWDTALREQNGHVNPLGLYDLDRNIRPVGRAYKQLIQKWRKVLPTQSVCLTVPVIRPSEFESTHAVQQREDAREFRHGAPVAQVAAQGG
jgi:beta-glucosidase